MTQVPDNQMHTISYGGKTMRMEYVFKAEIAALRARKSGQFQELPVLQWVKSLGLRGTYFDAGAHVGNHSLFFHSFCPSTEVISVEAHPKIYNLLKRNMDRNLFRSREDGTHKPIYLHNAAVWNSFGSVRIGAIPHNNAGHTKVVKEGGSLVQARTIDDLANDHKIVLLKIDVEDVEEQAIGGASRVLSSFHPTIIAERHTQDQLRRFEALLKPHGYKRVQSWSGIHTYAWR